MKRGWSESSNLFLFVKESEEPGVNKKHLHKLMRKCLITNVGQQGFEPWAR